MLSEVRLCFSYDFLSFCIPFAALWFMDPEPLPDNSEASADESADAEGIAQGSLGDREVCDMPSFHISPSSRSPLCLDERLDCSHSVRTE